MMEPSRSTYSGFVSSASNVLFRTWNFAFGISSGFGLGWSAEMRGAWPVDRHTPLVAFKAHLVTFRRTSGARRSLCDGQLRVTVDVDEVILYDRIRDVG